jgi:hypothetical protein
MKAICPTMRVMLLAIRPTMIAPIGPEPLLSHDSYRNDQAARWRPPKASDHGDLIWSVLRAA